jgi:deoxyinosine 3'endonuclease (endonuclease V)
MPSTACAWPWTSCTTSGAVPPARPWWPPVPPSPRVLAEHTAVVPGVAPYRPGEFYRRELPPLRAVVHGISGQGLLVADGYADLDPGGRPGLGAHAHGELAVPVIGVAKSALSSEMSLPWEKS